MRDHYDLEKTQAVPDKEDILRQLQRDKMEAQCGMTSREMSQTEKLSELFRYHPPNPEDLPKYAAINQAAKNFAEVILSTCPSCSDMKDAIRKIREARMTANAAIALNGLNL